MRNKLQVLIDNGGGRGAGEYTQGGAPNISINIRPR